MNAAASYAIKGAIKILAGLHPARNIEGSLPGIAVYIMFMEESLSGLTAGPFRRALHRNQWRKRLEQATTCREIKTLLLEVSNPFLSISILVCLVVRVIF